MELTRLYKVSKNNSGKWTYRYKCFCGVELNAIRNHVASGKIKSCGCFRRNRAANLNLLHGVATDENKRIWRCWDHMVKRCTDPDDPAYNNYGGRGISVCDEWMDCLSFFNWAINSGYREDLTIERKDVDGNYAPDNCTWIPKSHQMWNTRTALGVENVLKIRDKLMSGESQVDVAKEFNVAAGTISKINRKKSYVFAAVLLLFFSSEVFAQKDTVCIEISKAKELLISAREGDNAKQQVIVLQKRIDEKDIQLKALGGKDSATVAGYERELYLMKQQLTSTQKALRREKVKRFFTGAAGLLSTAAMIYIATK